MIPGGIALFYLAQDPMPGRLNMNSFYSETELKEIGFKGIGENVLVSRKASIYGAGNITLGSHVRIDDFTILSGSITVGSYVHIAAYVALYGGFGIEIGNFCAISTRCTLFSASDDFSGEYLVGPTIPKHLSNVSGGVIKLDDYALIGAHSLVMPGVKLGQGAVLGAMSTARKGMLKEWSVYCGDPAVKLKPRSREMVELSNGLLNDYRS